MLGRWCTPTPWEQSFCTWGPSRTPRHVLLYLAVCCCLVAKSCLTLLWSHGLLCPWDFPVKNTGVGCHFLLQGIFLIQGSNLHLLHWQANFFFYHGAPREALSDCSSVFLKIISFNKLANINRCLLEFCESFYKMIQSREGAMKKLTYSWLAELGVKTNWLL